jgi:ubiquinone/menaquinone biosynthesis C-methylase UbiE
MDDWRSYDDVAETYERVHASRFVQVADDLVAQAGIGDGHLLLDIGTGTGIAAEAATKVGARVVGIDE